MENLEERKTEAWALMDRVASDLILCYKRKRQKDTLLTWHELVGLASMYAISFDCNDYCKANPIQSIALSCLRNACNKHGAFLSAVWDYLRK